MNIHNKSNLFKNAINVALYLAAIAISFYFTPNTTKFEKNYEIGRPWAYSLVTAPMDFPIYKLDSEIQTEKDSVAKTIIPYIKTNDMPTPQVLDESISASLRKYINSELNGIYEKGIVSIDDYTYLKKNVNTNIYLISKGNIANIINISDLYTMRTAYDKLIADGSKLSQKDLETLKSINFDQYLKNNVYIESDKTKQSELEATNLVSPTIGMIQKGERIIDRGEVVDLAAYKSLRSLEKLSTDINNEKDSYNTYNLIGKLLLIFSFFTLLYSYFHFFRPEEHKSLRITSFILLMSLVIIIGSASLIQFTNISIYIIPYAILPIVICIFFDARTAIFIHIVTIIIVSIMVISPYEFLIIQIAVGCVAVSSLRDLHTRGQLIVSAIMILIVSVVVYTAINLAMGTTIEDFKWKTYLIFALSAISILFVYGLIYIIEKLFGFLSSMTLIELSNINNSLLMEFSEKCPGTFQHVLQVSNLSVEVAKKINANPLLARTGALYHDIGKMENPMLYTENQAMGVNPLNELPFDQAAQIVISHVQSGVKIAQKHGLPQQIIKFISTHHGNSKTKFFYNSYKNAFPDIPIDDSVFSYPGPLPSTKEAVIVMMADAIEAASRSLKNYNEETIDQMVEGIINGQMADNQYRSAPITFLQVETAKTIFKDKLKTIYHNRISYPKLENKETSIK